MFSLKSIFHTRHQKHPLLLKYTQSSNFRGFKRIRLSTYDYAPVEKGIEALRKRNPKYIHDKNADKYIYDLSGQTITIEENTADSDVFLKVYVGIHHVGSMFMHDKDNQNYFHLFQTGKIEKVHVRIDTEDVISNKRVFIGLSKTVIESRPITYLFVKLSE